MTVFQLLLNTKDFSYFSKDYIQAGVLKYLIIERLIPAQFAQRERAKARLEKLQTQISTRVRTTGISSATKLAEMQGDLPSVREGGAIPGVEWWDVYVLDADERWV